MDGGMTGPGMTLAISAKSFKFTPDGSAGQPAEIKAGGTVTFTNNDAPGGDNHSVLWDTPGSPPNTPEFAPGGSATRTMGSAGTFNYHCGVHGTSMHGSIQVVP
jgi:plastocyanin